MLAETWRTTAQHGLHAVAAAALTPQPAGPAAGAAVAEAQQLCAAVAVADAEGYVGDPVYSLVAAAVGAATAAPDAHCYWHRTAVQTAQEGHVVLQSAQQLFVAAAAAAAADAVKAFCFEGPAAEEAEVDTTTDGWSTEAGSVRDLSSDPCLHEPPCLTHESPELGDASAVSPVGG